MSLVKLNIHNSREGVLTISKEQFTCITDQNIKSGDIILHPLYSRVVEADVSTIVVSDVLEERPSNGIWKTAPATFRKCKYVRKLVPGSELKAAGYLRTEVIKENGKDVEKAFLNF